jgi:hypothetical protein
MEADLLPMIAVDGARIAYRRIGKGRPLVVLNGSVRPVQTGIRLS